MKEIRASVVYLAVVLMAWAQPGYGQAVTTGTISGVVTDQQGGVLPGASVTAVHQPTGTTYEAVTDAEGRFTMLNVRVGGPYQVTAQLASFRERQVGDVQVALGEQRQVDFQLPLATITETVTVTADPFALFEGSRAGTADNVQRQVIENLPSIARNLQDFARLSPHFNTDATNEGPANISVAGRNNRYNNIQIDGAVNNDVFAISDAITPGSAAETQPISIDAIQELQLVVAPYDVRQGGFSGGGVNAITKSGTNALQGTVYYYGRNQAWVGEGPTGIPIADFTDQQFGGTIGGPMVRNRAFYFGSAEIGRKRTPSGFSIDGSSGQRFGYEAEATRFRQILMTRYGYDPGGFEEFIRSTDNEKVFVRTDFNLGTRHQLTVRHNFVDGFNHRGFPDTSEYLFPDFYVRVKSRTHSTVGQLNSRFGQSFNELRLARTTVRDKRDGPSRFPRVEVNLPGAELRAGTENFSTANELDQDIIELTNDFTTILGSHQLTVGTHNEFFDFRNLFIRDAFGTYEFASLDLLEQGLAGGFDYSFSLTGDPRQASAFPARQLGFYAGDQWRATDRLTLTYGVRVDLPIMPQKPTRNPVSEQFFGLRTDITPESQLWSPRAGFNWNLGGEARQQLRGGLGLFSGRTPFVWLSNQYGNTGIEFRRLRVSYRATNRIPFVADPDGQPTSIGTASTNEIDLVDPDYKLPQIIRGNIAYDRDLGVLGLVGTAELLYSTNVNDIGYSNLNLIQAGTRPDGRPFYNRLVTSLSDVILLSNTGEGDSWSINFEVERPWRAGTFVTASYLYGRSRSINDGTSSQAASNWGNAHVPGDPNNPPLARSNFDPGHRINAAVSRDIPLFMNVRGTISMYYSGRSGRPYGVIYNGDANNDGRFTNDLLYVPRSADEIIIRNGTFAALEAYINDDECLSEFRGQIAPRNCARSPWANSLDLRFAAVIPAGRRRAEVTLDVLNVLNMLHNEWGEVEYATFNNLQPVRYDGIDAATGKMIYNIANITSPTFRKFTRDDLRSRWQAQLGLRFRF